MAVTATTPLWQNIMLKNVTVTGSTNAGILWGLPEATISQVVFDNVKIQATTGMQIVHATGISFVNGSTVTPRSGAASASPTPTARASRRPPCDERKTRGPAPPNPAFFGL
ncbi:MAG TPA: hypothetical protein VGP07_13015 [Polyangia bacterium]|jgi:hypothetical protein